MLPVPQQNIPYLPFHLSELSRIGKPWTGLHKVNGGPANASARTLNDIDTSQWQWPKKPIVFISDLHADKDAFDASLVASGAVYFSKKGKYKLNDYGRASTFIIGGDCLDKGPSNLLLLDAIKAFRQSGADVKILAGNHDLRLLMGLQIIGQEKQVGTEHMFVRMGKKALPLLREVFDRHLAETHWQAGVPDEDTCKQALFPRDSWFDNFPPFALATMGEEAIAREVDKMRHKVDHFFSHLRSHGLCIRALYAAAIKCRSLFLDEKGKHAWFFQSMKLALKRGSFLFVHAGLNDCVSKNIAEFGVSALNKQFRHAMNGDPFDFYFSTMSSVFRTKYRVTDPIFSAAGAQWMHQQNIFAIVHGHVNHCDGQQMSLQHGLLHIEGDITLDSNSRRKEGLEGPGFGATIIHPDKLILGISADFPVAKVFLGALHASQK